MQAVCDTPIARITGCVSSLVIWVGDSPWNYSVAIRVNRLMLVSLSIMPGRNTTKNKFVPDNNNNNEIPTINVGVMSLFIIV